MLYCSVMYLMHGCIHSMNRFILGDHLTYYGHCAQDRLLFAVTCSKMAMCTFNYFFRILGFRVSLNSDLLECTFDQLYLGFLPMKICKFFTHTQALLCATYIQQKFLIRPYSARDFRLQSGDFWHSALYSIVTI